MRHRNGNLSLTRMSGVALLVLGVVALALGYRGVAHNAFVADQLAFVVSGAFGGLALIIGGAALLTSANLADEWVKLDQVRRLAEERRPRETVELSLVDDGRAADTGRSPIERIAQPSAMNH
jgi:hypothetical protein